jgi:chromate reductase
VVQPHHNLKIEHSHKVSMSHYRIAVIVGSLRKESLNHKLAEALMHMSPSDFTFRLSGIDDLPLYNQDQDKHPAASVKRFKDELAASQGVLFVTPEYNRSIPGVLKNAIDHASRPYGDNSWQGKAAGVVGISVGSCGTAMAQQHLRNILAHLDAPTLGQPEIFIQASDKFFDSAREPGTPSHTLLAKWMTQYVAWVKLHSTPHN